MDEKLDKIVQSTKHVLTLLYAERRHLVSVKKIRTHCMEGANINFNRLVNLHQEYCLQFWSLT